MSVVEEIPTKKTIFLYTTFLKNADFVWGKIYIN